MPPSSSLPEQHATNSSGIGIPGAKINANDSHLDTRVLTAVTPRQATMVAAIRALHAVAKIWPSGIAVARALGITRPAAYRRLRTLERIGAILWAGGDVRIVLEPDGVFLTMAEVRA